MSPANSTLDESPVLTATKVLQQVWAEFSDWNAGECERLLASLVVHDEHQEEELVPVTVEAPVIRIQPSTRPPSLSTWTVYDVDEEEPQELTCPIVTCKTLQPAPAYEEHTDTNRNIWVHEEAEDTLSFVPFADDPSFDAEQYITGFKHLKPCLDPDRKQSHFSARQRLTFLSVEEVEAETARRLHFGHGFSFDLIDQTKVLSRKMLGAQDSETVGIFHSVAQRYVCAPSSTICIPDVFQRSFDLARVIKLSLPIPPKRCSTAAQRSRSPRDWAREGVLSCSTLQSLLLP